MVFSTNLIKKRLILFFLLLIFFLLILLNIFLNKSELNYEILKYKENGEIFIDRDYIDSSNSEFFYDKLLIKIPRHNNKKIKILSNSSLIIYRPVCHLNDNKIYFNNWDVSKININIKGISCIHSKVYSKKFNNFFINLDSGGPISADPIFIEPVKKDAIIKILNKKNK